MSSLLCQAFRVYIILSTPVSMNNPMVLVHHPFLIKHRTFKYDYMILNSIKHISTIASSTCQKIVIGKEFLDIGLCGVKTDLGGTSIQPIVRVGLSGDKTCRLNSSKIL
jgi:hypothetical protein